jgi:hypothetical protein
MVRNPRDPRPAAMVGFWNLSQSVNHMKIYLCTKLIQLGVVVHAYNPSTRGRGRRILSWRPARDTQRNRVSKTKRKDTKSSLKCHKIENRLGIFDSEILLLRM